MKNTVWKKVNLNKDLIEKLKKAIETYCDGNPNCVKF